MPAVFFGHGSPMNALADNSLTRVLSAFGSRLPRPKAVLMISAHWVTKGTWVTHMETPPTIHDFAGFPKALFEIQYPAPGLPALAEQVQSRLSPQKIQLDDTKWGLDHGTWSVLKHVFPNADVPVVQLSLDLAQPPEFHFELGKKIKVLRAEGILIAGSGNIVHNLRDLNWSEDATPYTWAIEFDEWAKGRLEARDFRALVEKPLETEAGRLSIPTPEHYYPLLYVLGAADSAEKIEFITEGIQNASISMRSVGIFRRV